MWSHITIFFPHKVEKWNLFSYKKREMRDSHALPCVTRGVTLRDGERDSHAWHCVTDHIKEQKPSSGGARGCSCLASARTFTSPKRGFNRWQGGCHFHILPLGARLKSRGISEHPPVTSRAEAGSPEGTLPLEGVLLYLVIHRMQALKQGSDGGQPSPP